MVDQPGLSRRRPPMPASEIPNLPVRGPRLGRPSAPGGFPQEVAAGLFTADGRHIGFLGLLSADPSRPSPADRRLVAAITAVIADDRDRTRDIAETARIVERAEAGVVLTREGDVLRSQGCPTTAWWRQASRPV